MSRKKPANRVFGNPQKDYSENNSSEKDCQEKVKAIVQEANRRRRAKRELDNLLKQFQGRKSLIQLLPVLRRRYPKEVVQLALERIKKRWNQLSVEDQVFVAQIEASLEKEEAC